MFQSDIVFKNKITSGLNFHYKDWIPKDLISGVIYKFQSTLNNESCYGIFVTHLNLRISQHIGISPLTKKQIKPKNNSVTDHLLFSNNTASYIDFIILMRENKKLLLKEWRLKDKKPKDCLLIMRNNEK